MRAFSKCETWKFKKRRRLMTRVMAYHVAYGSDMDGWLATMPRGFSGMAVLPKVTALLLEAGLPEPDVVKIMGANVQKVLETVC